SWEGRILTAPQGEGGFGYDPLFWLPELNCTSAQLPQAQKNAISHRGKAMAALLAALS
ncbi:MAG TPA: non-canonical purine NTP pyrophosphatase, partial [Cellvibrionaceae bacterium]|nr:non-canonical purine NTP pyrophosphatase [Cellvibrionaceae bacterium]